MSAPQRGASRPDPGAKPEHLYWGCFLSGYLARVGYTDIMTVAELAQCVLDLPPEERLTLVETLWDSLEQGAAAWPRRERRHAEIARFASEYAGTSVDLDPELEQAGIEAIEDRT